MSPRSPPQPGSVFINFAALQETEGEMVLRGVIDPYSLTHLKVDTYQREVLEGSVINGLIGAYRTGGVPDIILGMRGDNFSGVKADPAQYGERIQLENPVYIIDGQQRVAAGKKMIALGEKLRIRDTVW